MCHLASGLSSHMCMHNLNNNRPEKDRSVVPTFPQQRIPSDTLSAAYAKDLRKTSGSTFSCFSKRGFNKNHMPHHSVCVCMCVSGLGGHTQPQLSEASVTPLLCGPGVTLQTSRVKHSK